MNEIVSFNKTIEFKTMINKITSISLEHTLMVDNSKVVGDLIVSGTYKQTEASQLENPFSYKIPVEIEVDDKYDLSDIKIDIDDFTYDVEGDSLSLIIDIKLDELKLKEKIEPEIEVLDDLFLDMDNKEELTVPDTEPSEENEESKEIENNSESLFSNLDKTKETYETYSIYIIRENDSIEEIINKYHTSREKLEEYNNLSEIKLGSKIIIPNTKNE